MTPDHTQTLSPDQPILTADGTPLKRSLSRALRMQKIRALLLIAPLLLFVLLTFIAPIASMLFRSVENQIVAHSLPFTVEILKDWDPDESELPPDMIFEAMYYDLFLATEARKHTRVGSRLNYEQTGMASLFRATGRQLDDLGKELAKTLKSHDKRWGDPSIFEAIFHSGTPAPNLDPDLAPDLDHGDNHLLASQIHRLSRLTGKPYNAPKNLDPAQNTLLARFTPSAPIAALLPRATREYTYWLAFTVLDKNRDPSTSLPWELVMVALTHDLQNLDHAAASTALADHPQADLLLTTSAFVRTLPPIDYRAILREAKPDWDSPTVWRTIKIHSSPFTESYFLNAIDMRKTLDGFAAQPEDKQILITLFQRTVKMSLIITISCILLAYPVAYLLALLPTRTSNLLMILVLLPFWTSLLVRTSAWKVMLQQQGVINEILVWLGIISDEARLVIINNQIGTIVAMTHILLPFMILPIYSVMLTISPSYVRAAKSLGATNWTAFWRIYFPLSIPGIGAGSILVYILAIGYYITPEIVGGTQGVFISNRIAYHISNSLNWGLAAALGAILLVVVLILYWAYDKIVGIDNVKLG